MTTAFLFRVLLYGPFIAGETMTSTDRAFCLPEITHIIFSYLDPQSSATCRRVRKVWAIIGAQYFLPEMHIFKEQSFAYLQEASKDPIRKVFAVHYLLEDETSVADISKSSSSG
jgi:hypothetical protein